MGIATPSFTPSQPRAGRFNGRETAQQNVTTLLPRDILDFAFFPYRGPSCPHADAKGWPHAIETLAGLAEREDWSGQTNTATPYGILTNYIRYTYQRLVIERKICISDNGYATFNTGLLTPYGSELFGLFKRNGRDKQPWFFNRWVTDSDRDLMDNFSPLPDMAQYVVDAADLVYDIRRPLTLNTEHIIEQNRARFPAHLQNDPPRACGTLTHAKDMALKRLRRDYKLAIPQWFPTRGTAGAQLLLPLDLGGTGTVDLALVVSATEGGGYRGNTVITLGMAYSNARLVARPNSDWLQATSRG